MPRPEIRFEHRMSDADALMWHLEKDPQLRSTILVAWFLERMPDRARLEERIERATRTIPRLRQRVVSNPASIAPPRWETDPHFDRRFHVRWVDAPGEGRLRDVLDCAEPIAMQGFDRARPLWELHLVGGLEGGRAAMLLKLHHSLSDGVGLVRMTNALVERSADAADLGPMPPIPPVRVMTQPERMWDALGHERRRQLGRARRIANGMRGAAAALACHPLATIRGAGETLASLGRVLRPAAEPLSPLMRGRSLSVRFDTLALPVEGLRLASKRVGGKLNDAFVAGVAGGLRRYHDAMGTGARALRMSMPINIREGEKTDVAGNQFVPARFAVPVAVVDPVARMRAIRDLVTTQRGEPGLAFIDDLSGVLNRLPLAVSVALFGSMLKCVDFVTSNVPGPRFDVWVAGAKLERVVGFGPLAGAGLNVTLFSYGDAAHLGINMDPAAITDPTRFVTCLREGFDEVLADTV